jgi:hypothetical protein
MQKQQESKMKTLVTIIAALMIIGAISNLNKKISTAAPVETKTETPPEPTKYDGYDCRHQLQMVAVFQKKRDEITYRAQDAISDSVEHPLRHYDTSWQHELHMTTDMLIDVSHEYLIHPECTDNVSQVREIARDARNRLAKWPSTWNK